MADGVACRTQPVQRWTFAFVCPHTTNYLLAAKRHMNCIFVNGLLQEVRVGIGAALYQCEWPSPSSFPWKRWRSSTMYSLISLFTVNIAMPDPILSVPLALHSPPFVPWIWKTAPLKAGPPHLLHLLIFLLLWTLPWLVWFSTIIQTFSPTTYSYGCVS